MLSNTNDMLTGEHMTSEHISEIETEVIRRLAGNGPMSGYDFHLGGKRKRGKRTALMSSGFWIKVLKHLGPKGLNIMEPVQMRGLKASDDRGRRKDLYWLTEKGITYAISDETVNLKSLLDNTKKVYPSDNEKASLVEVLSKFSLGIRKNLLSMAMQGSKLGHEQLVTVTLIGAQSGLNAEKLNREMVSTLRKYPEIYKFYRKGLKRSAIQLKRLIRNMEGVEHE